MQAKIIKIGNSVGVRIPSVLVKQYNLKDKIELVSTGEGILIRSSKGIIPRSQWEDILSKMEPDTGAGFEEWDITLSDGLD